MKDEESYFICVKKLFENRGLVSPCRCPACRIGSESLSYYKEIIPSDPAHCDVFPDKNKSNERQKNEKENKKTASQKTTI